MGVQRLDPIGYGKRWCGLVFAEVNLHGPVIAKTHCGGSAQLAIPPDMPSFADALNRIGFFLGQRLLLG